MRIDIEFMISPHFLEGLDQEIKVCFKNVPYVPTENLSLWVKWEDFYDKATAETIYSALRENMLSARKILERFEKDRIFIQFDFLPYMPDDDDEQIENFPNLN